MESYPESVFCVYSTDHQGNNVQFVKIFFDSMNARNYLEQQLQLYPMVKLVVIEYCI